jgi:uncharacterized protein (DUF736 family)
VESDWCGEAIGGAVLAMPLSRVLSYEGCFCPRPSRPFCWRITRHNALAALADLCPAMARSRSSSPAAKGRHSSRVNKIAQPAILRCAAGLKAAGRSLRRSGIAIKAAMVAGLQQQEITMAQIGTFTRAEDGSFTGTIKTLSLNIKARFLPAEKTNEKAPDLRVLAGNVEIGAAWQRTSKENTVYHSVKLDDPSFSAPIYANLVTVDDGYALVWSR